MHSPKVILEILRKVTKYLILRMLQIYFIDHYLVYKWIWFTTQFLLRTQVCFYAPKGDLRDLQTIRNQSSIQRTFLAP